jgi:Uma2 family endonuclease
VRARIQRLIFEYIEGRDLGQVHGEKVLVAFTRNDYEPDILYFPKAVADTLEPDRWKCPVPDLTVEVLSPSSRKLDRGTKFDDYAAHHVSEYWIVDPDAETIEQYLGSDGVYRLSIKLSEGRLACEAIPGFLMTVRAAFEDDVNREARRNLRELAR